MINESIYKHIVSMSLSQRVLGECEGVLSERVLSGEALLLR